MAAEYTKETSGVTGVHIDGPPFVALLVNDRPGLQVGLGRIVALYYRSSTSYQIHQHIRCLCFWSDNATEP